MKKLFKNFLTKELAKYNAILTKNAISDEDRLSIEEAIQSLTETMEAVDAAEDDTVIEELKASVATLTESLEAIKEKINQTKQEVTMETENYLKTQNSVTDFLSAIRNSHNGAEFQKNWNNNLSKNAISVAEGSEFAFLPELVKGKIQDMWEKKADWLRDLKIVNAKGYVVRGNVGDKFSEDSRAKGWRPGCEKTEQNITIAAKKVLPQFIYKIQTCDAEMKFYDDGSLVDYLVEELVGQILWEEKMAVLIGDGRAEGCGHIDSIEPIFKGEGATTDTFTTINEATEEFLLDSFRKLTTSVHRDGGDDVFVFVAQSVIDELSRVAASDTSNPIYLTDQQLADQLRASRIIVTDILDDAGVLGIAMVPRKYVLVGQNILNPVMYTQHDIWTNTDVYRFEVPVAGAIEGMKSTAVLLPEGD